MTNPEDLPPPDLIDSSGRLRRLVLAFVIGVVAASIAYFIADQLAKPDALPNTMFDGGHKARAYRFVLYMAGFAFAGFFSLSLIIQNHLAKQKWRREHQLPLAKLR